jgi:phosphatidyl-myo-inositol dimannoside synthase
MKGGLKKALLVCTGAYSTDGGIAAVNRLTVQAFIEKGYSLDIFSLVERNTKIDICFLPPEAQVHYKSFAEKKLLFTFAVWRTLLQKSYDFILVDHVNLASILAPLAWLKYITYTVWLCGIEVFPPRPDIQGKLGLMGASNRLAISEFTRQSVINRFPDLSIKGCDLSLDPIRHANGPQQPHSESSCTPIVMEAADGTCRELEDRVILHVGRMTTWERYKGQESLIRALPMVDRQNPDAQLVLAGQGEDMSRLRSIAQTLALPVQARIFFPGYVPNDMLDLLYRKCYVFAMPSIGEGFGLVYLEAMVRAKACLGGRVDATPCVVRDGVTGLLVDDPKSPEQVAGALNWFLSHPDETHRMGLAGHELVNSYYMFPNFLERFWNAILA